MLLCLAPKSYVCDLLSHESTRSEDESYLLRTEVVDMLGWAVQVAEDDWLYFDADVGFSMLSCL